MAMEVAHLPTGLSAINLPEMTQQNAGSLLHDISGGAAGRVHVPDSDSTKVSIIGLGTVGAACAYALLQPTGHGTPTCTELALVDCNKDKLKGELMDLQHGLAFGAHCRVLADTDYAVTAHSKVCIITAGARRRDVNQSRSELIQTNVAAFKEIIPNILKHSNNPIILVVSNPVDPLTYVAWKLSGLPAGQVMGSGTNLDSARFRFALSQRLGIAPDSVHAWIVGEHGEKSEIDTPALTVAVWSGANIAGVPLKQLHPTVGTEQDEQQWDKVHTGVIQCVNEVISLKGSTSWAISLSVADIVNAILHNGHTVHAVTTNAKNLHGITTDTFLSLPCVLGRNGIESVVMQNLSFDEKLDLTKSAHVLKNVQDKTAL